VIMNSYRISDFCHFVDVGNNTTAIYNALTLGILFLNNKTADYIKLSEGGIIDAEMGNLPDDLIDELSKRRMIFPLGERYDLDDYKRIRGLLKGTGVAILYLLLTDGCNLGCSYCYIENGLPKDYAFSQMSEDTAERALQLFIRSISPNVVEPKIVLYGGEPLLNMKTLFYVVKKVSELKESGMLPPKTDLIINTNATLVDDAFLDFVAKYQVQISVSLDGTKEMHDLMRKQKDGRGTYDKVIANCRLMAERKFDFGFSVTITRANIHELEQILCQIHHEFDIKAIGFNIALYPTEAIMGMSEMEYAQLTTEKLISCFKICRKIGIFEDRIMRKVTAFVQGYPYIYDCGAPGDQLVITPDGMAGVCQAYIGSKENFVPMDEIKDVTKHPLWSKWRFRSPLYQKQCVSCISLGICGGGCPYNAEMKTGSIWGIDKTFCLHSTETVKFLIKDLYDQTQGAD